MSNGIPSVCCSVPGYIVGEKMRIQMKLLFPDLKSRIEKTEYGPLLVVDVNTQEEQDQVNRVLSGNKIRDISAV